MVSHRRSGIGAGIEGWMGADRYERELMLRQKRQEASIGHEKEALGFDERRVQLAEGRFGLEEQLFPSKLKQAQTETEAGLTDLETQRRTENIERMLGELETEQAPGISPRVPAGAPPGAMDMLTRLETAVEKFAEIKARRKQRELEAAREIPELAAEEKAGALRLGAATTGAQFEQKVPQKVAAATVAKAETEVATAGYQGALIKAREDNDLPALEAEVAGKILNLAEKKEIAEIDRAIADAKLRDAQADVVGKEKLKDDMIRKAYEAKGADYDQVLIDTHEVKSGLVMSSDDIIDNIQKAEASMTRVLQLPSADDPAMQAILDENPIYAFFMKPTADKAGAVEGLRKFIRVMKTRLKQRWGLDYDELAGTIPTTPERSAAVDELRRSRQ